MSISITRATIVLLALALVAPASSPAAPLTVSGSPRQINTFNSSGYACMNPAAAGGVGAYKWDLVNNPGTHFKIDSNYGSISPVGALAAGDYPITVRVTDAASATATEDVVVSVGSTGLVVISTDTIFDNYAGSAWFCAMGIFADGFSNTGSNTTWTITDVSGYFGIAQGYNTLTLKQGTPPAGDYPISLSLTQNGSNLGPFSFTMHVVPAQKVTNIDFNQGTVSNSQGAGVAIGTASAIVWEPGYQWRIPFSGSDGGVFTILDATKGVVSLTRTPAVGDRSITIQVQDGLNTYSQNFTVHVAAGTVVPAGNMSLTVPSNLDNYTSGGVMGTPAVSGIAGAKTWSFTGGGVGYRYAIDSTTGTITIIGCLSYNPTIDGVDYSDMLTVTCTDGIDTCTNSFRVPVAACVGPVLNVGPGQTYAHLNDAIAYCQSHGWGRPLAGVTFNIYPSSDPSYYLNDGQIGVTHGVFPVPVTIQGAPGQRFPKFWGGGLYYAKGFFMGYNCDLWVRNVEICNVTDGGNVSGNDNLTGVCKESSCNTGNVFVDNFYIHDCQDGIARGSHGGKWFITNGRISHCGVGETGYTHNIYVLGDLGYFKNILTDQSSVGHTFKSRCDRTIIDSCRVYDGELGHGSIGIDLPEGGVDTITNTIVQKGPNWQNPYGIHFAEPGDTHEGWPFNQCSVSGCTLFGDAWDPTAVTAVTDRSLAGTGDGTPASITMSGNSFFGYIAANYESTQANPSGGVGATSVSGSVALTAQPGLDWSFPGSGPDPTVDSPPGPFLAPYGVIGGAQIALPVNEIRIDAASPVGTPVVQPTWLSGNSGAASPTWSLRKNPGNRYAINASTGAISTAGPLTPGKVDVVEINVSQPPIQFHQTFGGATYYDHPADGSFIHSVYIVVSGSLPSTFTISASAGAGGSITPSGVISLNPGGSQTFTMSPDGGYVLADVTVDGVSVGTKNTYTFSSVDSNHTIRATFNALPNLITTSAGAGGGISPSGAVKVYTGASQSFLITAYTGHTIADVSVDSVSVGPVRSYTFTNVTANHTIAASFTAVGNGGAPVLVDFETAGQEGLFVATGLAGWARMAGHGGNVGQMQTGSSSGWAMYAPGGVSYSVGIDTISADVNLSYSGTPGAKASVGLVLQQKSTVEQYEAMLQASAGQITLVVGNLDASGAAAAGHSPASSIPVGAYTEGTVPLDLGWYTISAVVTTVNADQYQAAVTITKPDSTTASLTYVDAGAARYTIGYPAGFHVSGQNGSRVNVDNFRIGSMPVVQFQAASGGGPKSLSPANLVVTLSGIYSQPVTVTFARTGGTAVQDVDYSMPITSVSGLVALKRSGNLTDSTRLDSRFSSAMINGSLTTMTGQDMAQDADFYTNTSWAAQNCYCNYGGNPSIQYGATFFLSKFNLSSVPGFAGSTINKAQLRFYHSGGNTGINNTGYVTSSDWIEGTQKGGYPGSAGGASFAHPMGKNTNQNQNANGGTTAPLKSWANNDWFAVSKDVSGLAVPAGPHNAGNDFVVYDATQIVQLWAAGTPNYGFCTWSNTSNNFSVQYSESTLGANYQPVLLLDYAGQAITTTITFNPGETAKTIPLTILADSPSPSGGTIVITLSNPANATLGGNTSFTYTIVDHPLPGDVNGDGHVDVVDLFYLVAAFGSVTGDANYDAACDFNSDGSVDVIDLLDLVFNFGT